MTSVKTINVSSAIAISFAAGTASANGFFNVDNKHSSQQQPDTFNDAAHKDTAFWGYYNKNLLKETQKLKRSLLLITQSITVLIFGAFITING